jgi:hypothetical protein
MAVANIKAHLVDGVDSLLTGFLNHMLSLQALLLLLLLEPVEQLSLAVDGVLGSFKLSK